MAGMLEYSENTWQALPGLGILLHLLSTMAVDSPLWREDVHQNIVPAPLDLASHPLHHCYWSLMIQEH